MRLLYLSAKAGLQSDRPDLGFAVADDGDPEESQRRAFTDVMLFLQAGRLHWSGEWHTVNGS